MNMEPKRKLKRSLGKKLTLVILSIAVTLVTITVLIGYGLYDASVKSQYTAQGESIVEIIAASIDADKIDRYLETGVTDEAYDETLRELRLIKEMVNLEKKRVLYLYVTRPAPNGLGVVYIYDTDEGEDRCELGHFEPWAVGFADGAAAIIKGEAPEPVIIRDRWAWILSISKPIIGSDGHVEAYVGIDFSMDEISAEEQSYLFSLLAIVGGLTTALLLVTYLFVIRKTVITPVNTITSAVNEFLQNDFYDPNDGILSISTMMISTNDEIQRLAETMKLMERKIHEYVRNLNNVTLKAETDALTGLWNRDTFHQRVDYSLRDKQDKERIDAMLMIDVDYFKEVNDNYGHVVGDQVLIQCGKTMREVLRESDMTGRQGGDEFVVFCESVGSVVNARVKAKQIREAWGKIIPEGSDKPVTASIGIAIAPRDGVSFQQLYHSADAALYRAKEEGRDCSVVCGEEWANR